MPLTWVVSGSLDVPRESAARRISRSKSIPSAERLELRIRIEMFGIDGPESESTRTEGFCGSAATPALAATQRSSSGSQFEDCRSDANQISDRPEVSDRYSTARDSSAGKSAAVSVAEVAARSPSVSGEGTSWGFPLALSIKIKRAPPKLAIASRTFSMTICRRGLMPSLGVDSIEAERSSSRTTVSIEPLPQPMRPETIGRAAANTSAATASTRQVRIRM